MSQPRISLVIPAFNEQDLLPRLLDTVDVARQYYRHGPENVEVIVADNDSTDATADIAHSRGCVVQHVSKRLIAASRNGGAAVAQGETLAFADADFRIHAETFNYIDSIMALPHYIGGGTGLRMERWSLGIAVTWYLVLPPLWLMRIDGGVWFCRRADFLTLGGYDESLQFAEDVSFLRKLKRLGSRRRPRQRLATHFSARREGLEPALVLNSARKWDRHGDWHMISDMCRAAFYGVFARKRLLAYARRYWYEEREDTNAASRDGSATADSER